MAMSEAQFREIVQQAIAENNATVEAQVGTILSGVKQELANEINAQIAKANELSIALTTQSGRVTKACSDSEQRVSHLVQQFNQNNDGIRAEFETLRQQLGDKFSEVDTAQARLREELAYLDTQVDEKCAKVVGELRSSYVELVKKLKVESANTKSYIDGVEKANF